jgi:SAM-dependent methyltransferase
MPDYPQGWVFRYHPQRPCGFNFISEATHLPAISGGVYDFILSSHSLEHVANPLQALREWRRVSRPGAALVLILPHYKYTFDRLRPTTPVTHMLQDYEQDVPESDTTHFAEIIELHDLSRHPQPLTREELRAGIVDNYRMRCAHHHVFDEQNAQQLLKEAAIEVETVEFVKPYNILLLGRF